MCRRGKAKLTVGALVFFLCLGWAQPMLLYSCVAGVEVRQGCPFMRAAMPESSDCGHKTVLPDQNAAPVAGESDLGGYNIQLCCAPQAVLCADVATAFAFSSRGVPLQHRADTLSSSLYVNGLFRPPVFSAV